MFEGLGRLGRLQQDRPVIDLKWTTILLLATCLYSDPDRGQCTLTVVTLRYRDDMGRTCALLLTLGLGTWRIDERKRNWDKAHLCASTSVPTGMARTGTDETSSSAVKVQTTHR